MISVKKVALLGVAAVMIMSLIGCATSNSGDTTAQDDKHSAVQEKTITTRTVTFPPIYFNGMEETEAKATLEEMGGTNIVAEEDGSYTVTFPIDKYNKLVDRLHEGVRTSLDGIPNSADYPSFTEVSYDDTFSNVVLTSSKSELGINDSFGVLTVGMVSNMYQQIAGQPVSCMVSVIGPNGEEIASAVYPDALDNSGTDH